MICFFLNIRLFFIGKSTLATHYFPIMSMFVSDVSVWKRVQTDVAVAWFHHKVAAAA